MSISIDTTDIPKFWDWAFKSSPQTARFLFGGFLLLAVAALVLAWRLSVGSLVVTATVVLVAAVVVMLMLRALSRGKSSAVASFALWSIVVLVVAALTLFISAAFFGVPSKGSVFVARAFDLPELLTGHGNELQSPISPANGAWPAAATSPLDVSGDRFARLNALNSRPSIQLTPANLVRGGGTVYVNTLDIKGDAIITGGQELIIEAIQIRSEGGAIRALAPSAGSEGTGPGTPGGRVTLIVHDRIVGRLTVNLSGGAGGNGAVGNNGVDGRQGPQGENAASGLFDCRRGPGRGGDGGSGQGGEDGWPGFSGGTGGTLVLAGPDPSVLEAAVSRVLSGGAGGNGGRGGKGGEGGPPGAGGSSNGLCSGTGPSGAAGPRGANGKLGRQGSQGAEGSFVLRTIDANGILK